MFSLLTYKKFFTEEEAEEFAKLLSESGIESVIEHERDSLDKIYTGESFDPMFLVNISEDSFEKANELLLKNAESQLDDINPEYYLYNFFNDELIQVLNKPDEWNMFDRTLASKILSQRKISCLKITKSILTVIISRHVLIKPG